MINVIELSNELNSAVLNEIKSDNEKYGNLLFHAAKIRMSSIKLSYSNNHIALILTVSLHHADMPYPLYFDVYEDNLGQSLFSFDTISNEAIYKSKTIIQKYIFKDEPEYTPIKDWIKNELRTIPPEIWKIKPKFDDKG